MSSQQVEKRGQRKVIQTHHPERIDTSGRILPPHPHESARTQPQPLTNQDFDAINTRLLTAGEAIETSRQKLFETRLQELEKFARGSDAYKELHVQYGRRVEEVHEMTTKCLSLHKELEEPQNKISNYESTQRSVAAEKGELEDRVKDLETKGAERAQKIQIVLDRETWARNRIEELEKEVNKRVARECLALQKVDEMEKERGQLSLALQKVDQLEKERGQVIQEYRAEINRRMACESLAEQRIDELQKRVEELMQGQAAMSITVDHMDPAEQNVGEFGEKCGTSEPPKMVSIGQVLLPNGLLL